MRVGIRGCGPVCFNLEKVEEGVGRVGVVAAEGLQTKLAMHEYDGIACFEEIFRGCRSTRSCMTSYFRENLVSWDSIPSAYQH